MFMNRVLQEILNDKECKRSQNAELRRLCEEAIAELNSNKNIDSGTTTLPDLVAQFDYNRYFEPFELATKTGSSKLVKLSLDSIQKFIAHGHLLGKCSDPKDPEKLLIERIVKTICDCFKGSSTNEKVELQILKALLTILTSQLVDVHTSTLLLAVKTCFNICLVSRSIVNQTTARATLTQIINVVFFKMEQDTLGSPQENIHYISSFTRSQSGTSDIDDSDVYREERDENEETSQFCELDEVSLIINDLLDRVIELNEAEQTELVKNSHLVASRRKSDVLLGTATLFQKDAFYVLNSLCKISQRPLAIGINDDRIFSSFDYRSKQLALQLLLSIVQNPGQDMKNNPLFLSLIRNQLCLSLSSNAVSNIPQIFELSLAIFVSLLAHFKQHLKLHIEVFFKEILFPIVESPNSSFEHKYIVLRALLAISYDRQIILDLYTNYDCNLRSYNVFKQLISSLGRIGRGRSIVDIGCSTEAEELSFRLMSLECLVAILMSLKAWSAELVAADIADNQSTSLSTSSRSSSYSEIKNNGFGSTNTMEDQQDYQSINLEHAKQHKNTVEYGIDLFNEKPIRGLQYLLEHGIIKNESSDIASFLHMYEEKLNKRVVGEFLSSSEKTNKEIMHAYVDLLEFHNMSFISALRTFLAGFRLPGEAQKIDRLMEKFAARFCECNQNMEIFSNADTAYVLAYSIIMLTTDLHSSQVKQKMTKEQYINLNKGINESRDLPYSYLSKIYDEIANEEIRMKYPDDERRISKPTTDAHSVTSGNRNRQLLFGTEMEHIQYIARSLLENAASWPTENFLSISHTTVVGPMYKIMWSSCLATFSLALQHLSSREVIQLCLNGIKTGLFIGGIFNYSVEKKAYLKCLIHFTTFNSVSTIPTAHFHQPKPINMACIQALIETAFETGNFLLSSWPDVLRCLSQIDNELADSTGSRNAGSLRLALSADMRSEAAEQQLVVTIDRVFSNSINFNGDSIVEFVKALCTVSTEELKRSPPRTFCLQKILETSYYNMDRVRLQWSRTWTYVADHLIKACDSNNVEVVTFSLDSLRQLSLKFLEKEELTNFHFQEDFLRPFGSIMRKGGFATIRDMLLRCVEQMINSQARNIRSGWKIIISVILLGASDQKKDISSLAFKCICRITDDLLHVYFNNMVDAIQDCIKCLAEFIIYAESADVTSTSLFFITRIAQQISQHSEAFEDKFDEEVIGVAIDDRIWVKGWLPIVVECCSAINQCRPTFRTHVTSTLFDILNKFGYEFKPNWWQEAFAIIFRTFDRPPSEVTEHSKSEWTSTTCTQTLHCLTDLYCSNNFETLRSILLDRLHPLLIDIIESGHLEMSRAGLRCLEKLIFECCNRFSTSEWDIVTRAICSLIDFHDSASAGSDADDRKNGKPHQRIDGNFQRMSYLQLAKDEALSCAMGIVRNKSSFDRCLHQLSESLNKELTIEQINFDDLSEIPTRVMRHLPDENLFILLEGFAMCFEQNEDLSGKGKTINAVDRSVTVAWMEMEYLKRTDPHFDNTKLSNFSKALKRLTFPSNQTSVSVKDNALSHIAIVLLDVLQIDSNVKFLKILSHVGDILCMSIMKPLESAAYRFVLSQICLRRFKIENS